MFDNPLRKKTISTYIFNTQRLFQHLNISPPFFIILSRLFLYHVQVEIKLVLVQSDITLVRTKDTLTLTLPILFPLDHSLFKNHFSNVRLLQRTLFSLLPLPFPDWLLERNARNNDNTVISIFEFIGYNIKLGAWCSQGYTQFCCPKLVATRTRYTITQRPHNFMVSVDECYRNTTLK